MSTQSDCPNATHLSRRGFLGGAVAATAGALTTWESEAAAADAQLVARPPAGFVPFSAPGRVSRAGIKGDFNAAMHRNQIWPKPEAARRLLEKALTELTGAPNLVEAMKLFVHKDDRVAIKPNGIAGGSMSTSFELILPVVEACIAAGVPAENVMVYEQFTGYLLSCRVGAPKFDLPSGVKLAMHNNKDCTMSSVQVCPGVSTKYCRQLTEATAVINLSLFKDHSICGYTGAMKNMTHGSVFNPEAHHAHYANPQIALLYAHPAISSRVRLNIADVFRLMYDRGPLYKDPRTVVPHGAVYASTDPVALDTVGWMAVDEERKKHGLRSLADSGRAPKYIETAAELGLGIHDAKHLKLSSVEV